MRVKDFWSERTACARIRQVCLSREAKMPLLSSVRRNNLWGSYRAFHGLIHTLLFLGFGLENQFCNGTLLVVPGWRNW